jgi:hypothetical protein
MTFLTPVLGVQRARDAMHEPAVQIGSAQQYAHAFQAAGLADNGCDR